MPVAINISSSAIRKTAQQLDDLKHEWKVKGAPEQDLQERNRFILDCEEAISIENSA